MSHHPTKDERRDYTAAEKLAEIERAIIICKKAIKRDITVNGNSMALNVLRAVARDYRKTEA